MNSTTAENFMRSTKAPVTTAGVMMAKAIWNMTNTLSGMVMGRALDVPAPSVKGLSQSAPSPFRNTRDRSPMNQLPPVKARL
jgi:hypothetical protein